MTPAIFEFGFCEAVLGSAAGWPPAPAVEPGERQTFFKAALIETEPEAENGEKPGLKQRPDGVDAGGPFAAVPAPAWVLPAPCMESVQGGQAPAEEIEVCGIQGQGSEPDRFMRFLPEPRDAELPAPEPDWDSDKALSFAGGGEELPGAGDRPALPQPKTDVFAKTAESGPPPQMERVARGEGIAVREDARPAVRLADRSQEPTEASLPGAGETMPPASPHEGLAPVLRGERFLAPRADAPFVFALRLPAAGLRTAARPELPRSEKGTAEKILAHTSLLSALDSGDGWTQAAAGANMGANEPGARSAEGAETQLERLGMASRTAEPEPQEGETKEDAEPIRREPRRESPDPEMHSKRLGPAGPAAEPDAVQVALKPDSSPGEMPPMPAVEEAFADVRTLRLETERAGESARAVETAAEWEAIEEGGGPVSELNVALDAGEGRTVRLRFSERPDGVKVVARSADPEVAEALRSGLKEFREGAWEELRSGALENGEAPLEEVEKAGRESEAQTREGAQTRKDAGQPGGGRSRRNLDRWLQAQERRDSAS